MFKWRKGVALLALCLIFFVFTAARYSKELSPRWIKLLSTETWGLKITNSSGTDVLTIGSAGEVTGLVWPTESLSSSDITAGTTYQLSNSANFHYIDVDNLYIAGVRLPDITSSNDGEIHWIKYTGSGTSDINVYPYDTNDAIESTQGTFTGTIDSSLDAQGDLRAWQCRSISGASNVWYLLIDDLS